MPYSRYPRCSTAFFSIAAALALTGCGHAAAPPQPSRIDTAFELPGERVYPEGIAVDETTGDVYVGSFADGTIYRAGPGASRAETYLPAGTDGRRTANGLRVDRHGRLWVIDSTTGVAVYDTGSRALLARFEVIGDAPRFVNDIALGPDGSAYLTDSRRAVVYHVTPDALVRAIEGGGHGALDRSFDLRAALEPYDPETYTLNGIVADATGSYLLTVDSTGGGLYRIDLTSETGRVHRVMLDGGDLTLGDGLVLDGTTLWAAHNTDNTVTRWTVSADGTTATRTAVHRDDALGTPTTLARMPGYNLVVASQFDRGGPLGPGTPDTPFRVLSVSGI